MFGLQFIFSAAFICILFRTTRALKLDYEDALDADATLGRAVRSAYEVADVAAPLAYTRVARQAQPQFGLSEIHYYRQGSICIGVHLKSWILMTTGDCVYNMEVKKMFAKVYRKAGNASKDANVKVKSVTFHPKYKSGVRRHNIALLLLFTQIDWEVEPFVMPTKEYTVDKVLNKKLPTFVYEFRDGAVVKVSMSATKDTSVCGALSDAKGYYCVDRKGKPETMTKRDRGVPFVYEKASQKIILGHYTGVNLDQKANGHLFEEVFPTVYWVEEFVHEHPVPPDFP